eukprot:m51a1_g2508 hypothetical protein (150) ;mRNA; f:141746-142195
MEDDSRPLLREEVERRAAEYRAFIDGQLAQDLAARVAELRALDAQAASYDDLRAKLEQLGAARDVEALVDLGGRFYAQARVPDMSRVCVHVGLGFHVEMSRDEALAFVPLKVAELGRLRGAAARAVAQSKATLATANDALDRLLDTLRS